MLSILSLKARFEPTVSTINLLDWSSPRTNQDAARLLKIRGQAMQSAVPVGEGGMTALIILVCAAQMRAIGTVIAAGRGAPADAMESCFGGRLPCVRRLEAVRVRERHRHGTVLREASRTERSPPEPGRR